MIDPDALDELARNIEQHAFRRGYVSAFTLAAFPVPTESQLVLHITRECDGLVYGNAEVGTEKALKACVEALDGRVDYIVYDTELPFRLAGTVEDSSHKPKKSMILPYRDLDVWVCSVRFTLLALIPGLGSMKAVIVGSGSQHEPLGYKLAIDLEGYFGDVRTAGVVEDEENEGDAFSDAQVIIGAAVYRQVIGTEHIQEAGNKPLLVDAGIGTLTPEAAEHARRHGLRMIRVDNRAAMAGTLFSLIQSHDLVTRVMGEGEVNGVKVVAGGVVGPPGAVIVDSIDAPAQVIGFADGTGKVRYSPDNEEEREALRKVTEALRREHG